MPVSGSEKLPAQTAEASSNRKCPASGGAGLLLVAAAFVLAAALTWRKWPDVLVDFGTQLYIPWQLASGAVLYHDIAYYIGPFSQYFNALLFKIFGVSFSTLIAANLIFAAGMIFLVYRRFLAAADAWTATMAGLAIVLVFAFGEYASIGNYNYVAPYSYEALHGLFLSVLAVICLSNWLEKESCRHVIAAGFCAGAAFLTKPDIFFALALTVIAAFVLFLWIRRKMASAVKFSILFLFAALVPLLVFFFLFLQTEGWRESLRSVLSGWLPLFETEIVKLPYYRRYLGLDQPWQHLGQIFLPFAVVIGVLAFFCAGLRWIKKAKTNRWQTRFILTLAWIAPILVLAERYNWKFCGASLPLLSVCSCVLILYSQKCSSREIIFPLLWNVFGLVMLSKMGLFPRIWHYGFVLAMPAFIGTVYVLLWLLPPLLEKRFSVPMVPFRGAVTATLLVGFVSLFCESHSFYAQKNFPVGQPSDKIVTYGPPWDVGPDISAAVDWTKINMPANATLAVLPEGVSLNYLTRHVNPTPYLVWEPVAMSVFGQTNMTAAFEKNPPDYIFLIERDTREFGFGYFGQSPQYGGALMQWIGKNYQAVILFGHEPFQNGAFGVKILKRLR